MQADSSTSRDGGTRQDLSAIRMNSDGAAGGASIAFDEESHQWNP